MKASAAPGLALGELCNGVGAIFLDLVTAPRGLDVPVTGVSFHDPDEPGRDQSGHLLIVVGTTPDTEAFESVIQFAASSGIVGIACRDVDGWPDGVTRASSKGGVSLLSVKPDVALGELYELISASLAVEIRPAAMQLAAPEWRGVEDLSSICEAVGAVTGGAAGIEDLQGRVLAFSGGEEDDPIRTASILNRQVPESWLKEMRESGVVDRLLASDEIIQVTYDGSHPRRIAAIRFGRTVLGAIWVIGDEACLAPDTDDVIRRVAPFIAYQMIRERLVVSVERRMWERSLTGLLWGDRESPQDLEPLDLRPGQNLVVAVLEVISRDTLSPPVVGPRLIDLLTVHMYGYPSPIMATSLKGSQYEFPRLDERVYVLVSSTGVEDRKVLARIITECLTRASKTLGVRIRAGIGHDVASAGDLPLARQSAEDCIALAPLESSVVAFEDVFDRALMTDLAAFVKSWRGGASRAFEALLEHDELHGTEYSSTLRCVLDSFGNRRVIAERMHLHGNTVRYRIKRIGEITGVDLEDGDARLSLEIMIRAHSGDLDAGTDP